MVLSFLRNKKSEAAKKASVSFTSHSRKVAVIGGYMITIGGIRADELAKQYGTPLYAYDEAALKKQM